MLPGDFRPTVHRTLPDGVYEATILTIAACQSIYSSSPEGTELIEAAARHIVRFGGLPYRGPSGHLIGCFIGRNLVEGAVHCVDCACTLRMEAELKHTVRTFIGANTGSVLLKNTENARLSARLVEICGEALAFSEAIAFSLLPGMVVLCPATFRLVAPVFDCYGTGGIGLWGELPAASHTVYVVNGPKKAETWRSRLDDDSVPFFGREKELYLLRRYWERDRLMNKGPGPFIVHVVGKPGSGKSNPHVRRTSGREIL